MKPDSVSLPRSSTQWALENLALSGSQKVQLFQALSKVWLEPELAFALREACEQRLRVVNYAGTGEGTEIVTQLKTLLDQLDEW